MPPFGGALRRRLSSGDVLPFIGIYDALSASLAAREFDTLFLSGFSFAAARHGLPDEGFITWTDLADATARIRAVTPSAHLLVDMDDGYGDPAVAVEAALTLEASGASGIVLEDQQRPKKCGHLDGKEVMDLDAYLAKLEQVLAARRELVVVARTDAADPAERLRRARAFDRTEADVILIDGLGDDDEFLRTLRREVRKPLALNQIAGGKSRPRSWSELGAAGISMVIHSTPCLFAAHAAIREEMQLLRRLDGNFPEPDANSGTPRLGLAEVNAHLKANQARRRDRS